MKLLCRGFTLFLLTLLITNCKINRFKDGERHGRWIHYDTIDNVIYKSVGRYKKGIEQKTWKQFSGKKLVRLEKYKDGTCFTQYFHDNGKTSSEGESRMVITDKEIHWFYTGKWKFYDENGQLLGSSSYDNGNLIETIEN